MASPDERAQSSAGQPASEPAVDVTPNPSSLSANTETVDDEQTEVPRVGGRKAFVHAPAPRKTQPAVNATAEDFAAEDYVESTSYTAGGRSLSGSGYRRSRHGEEQLKRNLRYGRYLEVPKGQRAIFSSQGRRSTTALAYAVCALVIVLVIIFVVMFWPR